MADSNFANRRRHTLHLLQCLDSTTSTLLRHNTALSCWQFQKTGSVHRQNVPQSAKSFRMPANPGKLPQKLTQALMYKQKTQETDAHQELLGCCRVEEAAGLCPLHKHQWFNTSELQVSCTICMNNQSHLQDRQTQREVTFLCVPCNHDSINYNSLYLPASSDK